MEKEKTAGGPLLPWEAEGGEIRCSLMLPQGRDRNATGPSVPCLATLRTPSQCGCYWCCSRLWFPPLRESAGV